MKQSMPIQARESPLGQFHPGFPYPPRARRLLRPQVLDLYPALLSQAVGDFRHERVAPGCSIWVIGCGANQAVITALMFPDAHVLGTDVSEECIRLSLESSRQLGISNLDLRQEKLSSAAYSEDFDYIICTGVLHHHPDPESLLAHAAAALRPAGVLEAMVYSTFHRTNQASFRAAMKLLDEGLQKPCPGRQLASSLTCDNSLALDISEALTGPEEEFSHAWLNSFEQSFTISSFMALASACGLELDAPRITPEAGQTPLWDMEFDDPDMQDYFEACDDHARWQIAQFLLMERSPMIWFYLRRKDSPLRGTTDAQRNEDFLGSVARRVTNSPLAWDLGEDNVYRPADPPEPPQPVWVGTEFQEFYNAIDGKSTVAQICDSLALPTTPVRLRRLRALLTVPERPYVIATRQ